MKCPKCDEEMEILDECDNDGNEVWGCTNENCGEVEYR